MALFDSDIAKEVVLFSVDAVLSILFLKTYNKIGRYISSLKEVSAQGEIDELENLPSDKSKYVMVRGSIKALGSTIPSVHVPNSRGVVHKLGSNELLLQRNSSGFWQDDTKKIFHSFNSVPFAIVVGNHMVEVQDVQLADQLHLETVYINYERTVNTFAGSLANYFLGVRPYGVQTTEEMLKEGTTVTAIGNLIRLSGGEKITLGPCNDKPYFITTQPLSSLLQNYQDDRTIYRIFLIVTGGLTVYFGSRLGYRLYIYFKKRREKRELQRRLDESRRARRQTVRDEELPEYLQCVICNDNPREVILLPCGHLCLCEDCSKNIPTSCPVCRNKIETRAAAFLS